MHSSSAADTRVMPIVTTQFALQRAADADPTCAETERSTAARFMRCIRVGVRFGAAFGFESLRDLADMEKLEDTGLLGRRGQRALGGDALTAELKDLLGLGGGGDEDAPEEDAA